MRNFLGRYLTFRSPIKRCIAHFTLPAALLKLIRGRPSSVVIILIILCSVERLIY